jgi:alpha-1,6-mannosyltransferase
VRWALVAAGLLLEMCLLGAASASGTVTESRGFRDAFAREAPTFLSATLEAIRRVLTGVVMTVGGPPDETPAAAVALVVALVLAGVAYTAALLLRPVSLRSIVAFSLLFQVTLLAMLGLLSTDLLTYATYGRLAGVYGKNPYLSAPSAIVADPLVQWLDTRPEHASPYGPLWTLLSLGMAQMTAGLDPLGQALSYRVLGSLAHLTGMAIVWRLARDPTAVLLFAWNPLLLLENVGSGHNDGLMMVLALAGWLFLRCGRARLGLVVFGLATLIKYVPGLLLLYAGTCLARSRPRLVATTTVAILVLGAVLWLPWVYPGSNPGVLLASVSAGGERYVNALVDLPTGWLATHLVDRSGQDVAAAEAAVRAWPRVIVRVLFVLYVTWELLQIWRSDRETAVIEAAVRSYLVALLLVVTQVLTWYFTWPVALAAALGWRSTLARVAVAYSVVYLPVFYAIHAQLLPNPAPVLLGYAILPPLIFFSAARAALGGPRPGTGATPGRLRDSMTA